MRSKREFYSHLLVDTFLVENGVFWRLKIIQNKIWKILSVSLQKFHKNNFLWKYGRFYNFCWNPARFSSTIMSNYSSTKLFWFWWNFWVIFVNLSHIHRTIIYSMVFAKLLINLTLKNTAKFFPKKREMTSGTVFSEKLNFNEKLSHTIWKPVTKDRSDQGVSFSFYSSLAK